MKNFFLTLDLEEWYHLQYFNDLNEAEKKDIFIFKLNDFFDFLDSRKVKITVFVVAELAKKYPEIIKNISSRGHEIACHGLDHKLDYNKTDKKFISDLKYAKNILEEICKKKVLGYRSPCFSLTDNKLELVSKLGFRYDSSYVNFESHKLYNKLSLKGYRVLDNLIYIKGKFKEFEVPTYKLTKKINLPISGGAYFRFLPLSLTKLLIKSYYKTNKNFIFYIHPFELNSSKINLSKLSFLNKVRFQYKRKNNLERFKRLVVFLQASKVSFKTINDII
tara:strand:- start:1876 stop:2706 length:831 start_codon:yes stop_codon:yes gene_type:complete